MLYIISFFQLYAPRSCLDQQLPTCQTASTTCHGSHIRSTNWGFWQPLKAVNMCKRTWFLLEASTLWISTPLHLVCRPERFWTQESSTFSLERSRRVICTPASVIGAKSGRMWLTNSVRVCKCSTAKDVDVPSGFRFVSLKIVQNFWLVVMDSTRAPNAGRNMIGVRLTSADKTVVGKPAAVSSSVQKSASVSSHK